MNVRYWVELSQAERGELTAMLSKGKRAARKLKRAQILLAADAGCSDEEIARTVAVGGSTVYRTKRRFVEGNLEQALSEIRVLARSASSPARKKPCWWQRLAQTLPTGAPAGRWNFWPTPWSSSPDTRACRARRCAGGWPKTVSSLAQRYVVHSPGRRRVCRPHGRRARPLCRSARPEAAGGVPRREPVQLIGEVRQPIRPAGSTRTLRLRVPPQRHRQSLRLHRRASTLAQDQGHRAAGGGRLRPVHARTRRCPLPRCRVHPGRAG